MDCYHLRIKRNYPHGRKSKPIMYCKDCKEVLTKKKVKDALEKLQKDELKLKIKIRSKNQREVFKKWKKRNGKI